MTESQLLDTLFTPSPLLFPLLFQSTPTPILSGGVWRPGDESRRPLGSLIHPTILVLLDLSEVGLNLPGTINSPIRSAEQ